jgi:hypothetical protein
MRIPAEREKMGRGRSVADGKPDSSRSNNRDRTADTPGGICGHTVDGCSCGCCSDRGCHNRRDRDCNARSMNTPERPA